MHGPTNILSVLIVAAAMGLLYVIFLGIRTAWHWMRHGR